MNDRSPAAHRACAVTLALVLLTALAACRTPPPRAAAPAPGPGPYDWHPLLIVPIGSVLKDVPLNLHEVLLFSEEPHGGRAADDAECYAADGGLPRFAGRTPDDYLLCFQHDRLSRIEVSLRLTAAEAQEVFAAACAGWLKQAIAPDDTACEGRDGDTRVSGRLGDDAMLSITLDGVPAP
jgi:hypothetical protein